MVVQDKRLMVIVLGVALLLLVPLIAMQFTNEVNWTSSDFVIAAVLLLGTGLCCELIMRKVKKLRHRVILCGAVLFGLLVVWAELAVGLFGTPFAGN